MIKRNLLLYSLAAAFLALSAYGIQHYYAVEKAQTQHSIYQNDNWVQIPAGEFVMGSPNDDKEANTIEKPQRKVTIAKPFKISRYEVTFAEYDHFASATYRSIPSDAGFSNGDRGRLPVINVSWKEASAYAKWLSQETGLHFRLPTEAEWEYAARAGTTQNRFWGDDTTHACEFANVFDNRNQAKIRHRFSVPEIWAANFPCGDAYFSLAPVGSFKANPWGLYDMLGNVWEWVQDCKHNNYQDAPKTGNPFWDNENGGDCTKRGVRGGSWFVEPQYVRVTERSWNNPDDRGTGLGFRLVQD